MNIEQSGLTGFAQQVHWEQSTKTYCNLTHLLSALSNNTEPTWASLISNLTVYFCSAKRNWKAFSQNKSQQASNYTCVVEQD